MIKKLIATIVFLISFAGLFAQIVYDFENLSLNDWTQSQAGHFEVSTTDPISGLASLHHSYDNPSNGTDQISLATNLDLTKGTVIWKFKVRHGYNPSGSNNWAVILASDKDATGMTASGGFNGYAIGVDMMTYSDDTLCLYRIDGGSPTQILKTSVNWQEEVGTSQAGSIVVIRTKTGKWEVYFSHAGSYDTLTYLGQVFDNTYTSAQYFGIYYEYTSSQDKKLWFDDLQIYKMFNQQNAKFYLTNISDSIQSTSTSTPGTDIARLTFAVPASDTAPVVIKQIIITPSSGNNISNWQDFFAGVMFNFNSTNYTGIINQNNLIFNTNITLQPGDSLQGTISAWLKAQPKAGDNAPFSFLLTDYHIVCNPDFNSFSATRDSTDAIKYSVEATKLTFDQVPLSIIPDQPFYIKILATDDNNNQDKDASYSVTLSVDGGNGTLSAASGLTKSMTGGAVEWNDLQYNTLDNFKILAYSTEVGGYLSPVIHGNTYLYFLNNDFEDGDISDWIQSSPGHWLASSSYPLNGSYSLRHVFDNTVSATEWIAHRLCCVNMTDTTVIWKFTVRYDYSSPSSSNNWNILLMSDVNPIDSTNYSGYGIGINWNSSDDLIKLWKITDGNVSTLASSDFNYDTRTSAGQIISFLVSRSPSGQWSVAIDTLNNDSYYTIITAADNQFTAANYFAVRYQYTSSQDQKLTLDDIYFGQPIPDTIPPHTDTALALSADTVMVYFNEDLDTSGLGTSNFVIDDTLTVKEVVFPTLRTVRLTLADTLSEEVIHTVKCTNISDIHGNIALSLTQTLKWTALHITHVTFPDSLHITVHFNKTIDTSTVRIDALSLQPYTGSIVSLFKQGKEITLTLDKPLTLLNTYTLKSTGITDLYHNPLKDSTYNFIFYLPHYGDVIVNEIMFDVSPVPPALPAYKYIELYNRTSIDINLNSWSIGIGDAKMTINKNIIIKPGSYAIICAKQAEPYFSQLAPTAAVLNEAYLTTTGKTISVIAPNTVVTDQVKYSTDWYGDADKDNGGWSVERIDPDNQCNQDINWHACQNPIGGTPGFVNSVLRSNPDTTLPQITGLQIVSSNTLKLSFNKTITPGTATRQINYIINESVTPLLISYDTDDPKMLVLRFLVNFTDGQNTLLVRNLQDYCNNVLPDTLLTFSYQKIHPIDVEPISQSLLKIYFSEPVEKTSAEQVTNYTISGGAGNPMLATVDNQDNKIVYLVLDSNLVLDQEYTLSIAHVRDINGNEIDSANLAFTPHIPQPYDVIFNEFMTDVSPAPAGLAPLKYIELYNTKDFDIWLSNWTLSIDGKTYTLPPHKIKAHEYLLLTAQDNVSDTTLGLFNDSYVNTNATYKLYSSQGQTIDIINLNENFWHDQTLAQGGVSAERINPAVRCETEENWTASLSPAGGTPGQENSVHDPAHTVAGTYVARIKTLDAYNLQLNFSTPVLNSSVTDKNNFLINGQTVSMLGLTDRITLNLRAVQPLKQGNNKLTLSITDDCGNQLDTTINFDYQFIHVQNVVPIDSQLLLVIFSEPPYQGVFDRKNYVLNNNLEPDKIVQSQQDSSLVYLVFNQTFNTGINQVVIENIADKYSNTIPAYTGEFTSYVPQKGDLIINELLFDPLPGHAKYVELYNKADYAIYLNNISLANYQDSMPDNIVPVTSEYVVLSPQDFVCLTTDTADIKQTYPVHGTNFIQVSSLPSLSSTEGNIAVMYKDSLLDLFEYSVKLHSPIINDPEGVALERINYDLPTNAPDNWTSASQTSGFGTPAMQNSQYLPMDSLVQVNATLSLSSRAISPDNDGYQDYLLIRITTEEPGLVADIKIINASGRIIKTLASNTILGSENTWRWDGTDNNGMPVAPGIYVIMAKIFSTDGRTTIIKKPVAITKQVK